MSIEVELDGREIDQLRRAFERLPQEIKTKVMGSAMRKLRNQVRSRIVTENAQHTQMPKNQIRDLTSATFNAGGNTQQVTVESGWIHLYRLGAVQDNAGVHVAGRGHYGHAFIAKFKSGHIGVMRRIPGTQMSSASASKRDPSRKIKREQLRELFGANPAHAITNNPQRYLEVLAEVVRDQLYPNFEAEMLKLIGRK